MARALHPNLVATLGNKVIKPFYALDLHFDSGTLYLWTGNGTRTINGNDYIGSEDFLSVSNLSESLETVSVGLTITLSAVPNTLTSVALSENIQNRKCTLYYGDLDVAEVSIIYEGLMDQMPIDEGAETSVITLTVEHELSILEKAVVRRYTSASQKLRFPNDQGLDFVNNIQDVKWIVK